MNIFPFVHTHTHTHTHNSFSDYIHTRSRPIYRFSLPSLLQSTKPTAPNAHHAVASAIRRFGGEGSGPRSRPEKSSRRGRHGPLFY